MKDDGNLEFESEASARTRPHLVGMLLGLAATLSLWAVVIGWLVIPDTERSRGTNPAPPPPAPTGPQAVLEAGLVWDRYVEATDFAGRAELVLDTERVRDLMEDFHRVRGHPWPSMSSRTDGREIRRNGQTVVVFQVEGFDRQRYPVALAWDGERFAVDWESLTAYGTMDWSRLLETRPHETQTLRIYLARLPEELQPPASRAAGRTFFRMEHRDHPTTAVLAVRPELAPEVFRLTEGLRVPCTAEVAWNSSISAFELKNLLCQGWNAPH